jgi:hypothetical protein
MAENDKIRLLVFGSSHPKFAEAIFTDYFI